MNPACTCSQGEWRHHHAFGGVYPCEGTNCIQCQPLERQRPNGRDDIETRAEAAADRLFITRRRDPR